MLTPRHGRKRNVLRRLGDAENDAGVLHGEKPLGNVNVKKDGADQSANGHEERGGAVAQNELQRPAIKSDDGVKGILRFAVEPAFFFFFRVAKKFGAHHRSQSEGDEGGNENGDREGDGKFAEQAADDVAHEEQRNKHGNQGNGQRHDGESDLFGALQRGLQR